MRTLKQLAQEAIDIQNACNIGGISLSFPHAVAAVREAINRDVKENPISLTRYENLAQHPIVQLWASKIHDMTHMGLSDTDAYGRAYDACKKMAGIIPSNDQNLAS